MFKQKEWVFTGKSGKKYPFEIFKKASIFPSECGIYILAYTHPRGHLAGFETHALYIGNSNNIEKTMSSPPQQDCVTKECWNCTYVLRADSENERLNILSDLQAVTPTPC